MWYNLINNNNATISIYTNSSYDKDMRCLKKCLKKVDLKS